MEIHDNCLLIYKSEDGNEYEWYCPDCGQDKIIHSDPMWIEYIDYGNKEAIHSGTNSISGLDFSFEVS